MKMRIFLTVMILLQLVAATGQDLSLYQKKMLVSGRDSLPYRILLPESYNPAHTYPLILFLHGSGERGHDNEAQLVHGASLFLLDSVRKNYPAIVVFPQCAVSSYWSNVQFQYDSTGKRELFIFSASGEPTTAMKLLQQLLFGILKTYPVNKKQVYVGGLSMGGMGTFELVRRNPALFAAAFPICGGGAPAAAPAMKQVKWWVFHGEADDVVPPAYSADMVAALQSAGAEVKFSLYPGVNHNSWDPAFAEPGLLPWLFAQKRK